MSTGLATAEADQNGKAQGKEKAKDHVKIEIIYNGLDKPFEVKIDQTVRSLLDKAMERFGPIPSPHLMGLFNQSPGSELKDSDTVQQAGVKPGDRLLLRQSEVRGG